MESVKTCLLRTFRRTRFFGAIVAAFVGFSGESRAASRWATLEAIHALENPRNLSRPGPFGELGAYQFREMTWRIHTTVPFAQALNRQVSDQVAILHYDWLKRGLEQARLPVTSYNIALAWNGGLNAVRRGSAPSVAHDYASRAVNLADSFESRAQVAASP